MGWFPFNGLTGLGRLTGLTSPTALRRPLNQGSQGSLGSLEHRMVPLSADNLSSCWEIWKIDGLMEEA